MRIDTMLETRRPVFSFEFFPPETDEGMESLFRTIAELRELEPSFVSVTCRNHSRHRTLELVTRIRNEVGVEPMAHYTCAGATRIELHEVLRGLREAGIDNVLALRGDPPKGEEQFRPNADGLSYGCELAAFIRDTYDFCIGGACYPEGHPEAASLEEDIRHTVAKVEAGASFLITQLFFENRAYFDFVARARAAAIDVPIVPGIMPITGVKQLSRFTSTLFGASIPDRLREALQRVADQPEAVVQLGVAYATLQCAELLASGAPGIHFYTLNRSPATRAILAALLAARPWERAG
jgi:methylenetetrahydrofolate reductase (NADPH)